MKVAAIVLAGLALAAVGIVLRRMVVRSRSIPVIVDWLHSMDLAVDSINSVSLRYLRSIGFRPVLRARFRPQPTTRGEMTLGELIDASRYAYFVVETWGLDGRDRHMVVATRVVWAPFSRWVPDDRFVHDIREVGEL